MQHRWLSRSNCKQSSKPFQGLKKCANCEKEYITDVSEQVYNIGLDYDICPYCSACNGVSTKVSFTNRKVQLTSHDKATK